MVHLNVKKTNNSLNHRALPRLFERFLLAHRKINMLDKSCELASLHLSVQFWSNAEQNLLLFHKNV